MRKEQKYSCSKRSKTIAGNVLRTLSKEGYDPNLLLQDATDNFSRKFFRKADCMKARPILETQVPIEATVKLREIPADRSQQEQLKALARRLSG
jgi:DTW domain-containing protein YfiP